MYEHISRDQPPLTGLFLAVQTLDAEFRMPDSGCRPIEPVLVNMLTHKMFDIQHPGSRIQSSIRDQGSRPVVPLEHRCEPCETANEPRSAASLVHVCEGLDKVHNPSVSCWVVTFLEAGRDGNKTGKEVQS